MYLSKDTLNHLNQDLRRGTRDLIQIFCFSVITADLPWSEKCIRPISLGRTLPHVPKVILSKVLSSLTLVYHSEMVNLFAYFEFHSMHNLATAEPLTRNYLQQFLGLLTRFRSWSTKVSGSIGNFLLPAIPIFLPISSQGF